MRVMESSVAYRHQNPLSFETRIMQREEVIELQLVRCIIRIGVLFDAPRDTPRFCKLSRFGVIARHLYAGNEFQFGYLGSGGGVHPAGHAVEPAAFMEYLGTGFL